MSIPFNTGNNYSRKDIYRIINVPEDKQGGNWNTGYTTYLNDVFIFVNINSAGRTGHDYDNKFLGDDLQWFSKNTHTINSSTIKSMLNPSGNIYIFTREDSTNVNFTYQGIGRVKEYYDTKPVKIIWEFTDIRENHPEKIPEEIISLEALLEGTTKSIEVNVYERNPIARKKCIDYYGLSCFICGFNFQKYYGSIGENYIHVHHLIELNMIKQEYEIDPINDLRPVCPNCHAMLHRRKPAFSIEEIRELLNREKVLQTNQ